MEHIRASQTELITTMSGVRLCLFDAMVRLKMIRKFAFSWLHGCVPASNVPHDLPPDEREAIMQLDASWSVERLSKELRRAQADIPRLQRMAELGRALVTSKYSCAAVARRSLAML